MNIHQEAQDAVTRVFSMLERKSLRQDEEQTRLLAVKGDRNARAIVRQWDREDGLKSVPLWLPDGRDVHTVDQVAAIMNISKKVAAMYVLETPGLSPILRNEARKLVFGPESDTDGIAIMLQPREEDAIKLTGGSEMALRNGPRDLHVTLGYFGNAGDKDAPPQNTLLKATQRLSEAMTAVQAKVAGLTRFNGSESDPVVLNIDSQGVERMRMWVLYELGTWLRSEHGFTPHMTIGYIDPDEQMDFTRWPNGPTGKNRVDSVDIIFDRLVLGIGSNYTTFELGTGKEVESDFGKPYGEKKDVFTGPDSIPPKERRIKKIIERGGVIEVILDGDWPDEDELEDD